MKRWLSRWPEALLFAAAFTARLVPEILHGGFTGNFGYDPSVYYAAADSFIHGRMPYRDFILLHPPGVVLVDTPFAWFGSVTTDQIGFAAVTIGYILLGATNAVLVSRVALRLGLPRKAALAGGVVYALYPGSLFAEYEARLEPLGCFLLLCALLALTSPHGRIGDAPSRGTRLALGAGVLLGCAMSVKMWWTVPAAVLIGWELVSTRSLRRTGLMVTGVLTALVAVDGPFALLAGSKMWHMVVLDQFGRPPNNLDTYKPLAYLVTGWYSMDRTQAQLNVIVAIGAVVLLVLVARAWRIPASRGVVLALVAQLLLIVVEPTWFQFYADFVTVPLALVFAAAVVRRARPVAESGRRRAMSRDVAPWFAFALAACMAFLTRWTVPESGLVSQFPAHRLAAAAQDYRCVMSDSPMGLIELNVLTRDLQHGCPDMVDVTGLIFDLHRQDAKAHEHGLYRMWNNAMITYLRSGNAVIFFRTPKSIDLYPATARLVARDGAIVSADNFFLYRVVHPFPVDRVGDVAERAGQ